MFFALTDEQREFGAAVRDYLADRFDLAAVRGVVRGPRLRRHPGRRSGRPPESRAGSPSPCPRSSTGSGSAWSRRRSSRVRWARAWRPGRGGAPSLAAEAIRLAGSATEQKADLAAARSPRVRRSGRSPRAAPRLAAARRRVRGGRRRRRRADGDGLTLVTDAPSHTARLRTTAPCGWPTSRRATGRGAARARAAVRARPSWPGPTVLVAADLVGIAREALTRTVAYDRERRQFGVPVGSFQVIKHDAGRPARRRHDGRARRALRRARRRHRSATTPSSPWPSPRPRRATPRVA